MAMPLIQLADRTVQQLQTNVASVVNPLLDNPLAGGHILKTIVLAAGVSTAIPHLLGHDLKGWFPVRIITAAIIHDQQSFPESEQFLRLIASIDTVCDVYVF